MEESLAGPASIPRRRGEYLLGFGVLLAIAVVGLGTVKWAPYFQRSLEVAASQSLGGSILGAASAAPSLLAAVEYTVVYLERIWTAMVVGLLLAATVQALVPRDWLARVLGSSALRGSMLGGVLALPGMM